LVVAVVFLIAEECTKGAFKRRYLSVYS